MKILVAEDNQVDLKLLKAQLDIEGHTVVAAADGAEALAALQRESVDAIISDILMPHMDGYRLCYEVRKDERFRDLPFIFYTSTYTSPGDEKFAMGLTADHFLRKPATAEEIIRALKGAARGKPGSISLPNKQMDELGMLQEYSERLVSKLEERNLELARANEELRSGEARLQLKAAVLENTANAIIITDPDGKISWINPAFTKLTGYSPEETLGKTPRLLKSGEHDQAFYCNLWKTILAGQAWRGEFTNCRKDGARYYAEQTITPVRGGDGSIAHFIGVINDVTERKRLEEQFVQAQKMEVVGHLAGGVAHDFNNILGIIMIYSDLARQELGRDHPAAEAVEQIHLAAERAVALTRQLLIFSRKQVLEPVVLEFRKVLSDLDKMLRRLIDENIELTIDSGKETGRVKADPGYLGQVLMNLVVNARDAMPDGGKLTIESSNVTLEESYTRAHPDLHPGEYVMFAVSDTGTGMTPEVKARIFEAFFTTKPKGKGTGLGLATCDTIVKQCCGHIGVYSEVGKGTTFKVYLPRVDLPLDSDARRASTEPMPRGTETLLVVEDEPALRHLAASVLEGLGYTVLSATNGQDGLRVAREHKGPPIQMVVTDVVMPQMSGHVMAEWLTSTYPDLKVLFTSGYTDSAISRHGVLDEGVSFLSKPYTTAGLALKVREVLERK